MKRHRELLEILAEQLDLPEDALPGTAKLSVTGGRRALIENHRGILEYGTERIVVKTISGRIILSGTELKLLGMNPNELLLGGKLQNVEWV